MSAGPIKKRQKEGSWYLGETRRAEPQSVAPHLVCDDKEISELFQLRKGCRRLSSDPCSSSEKGGRPSVCAEVNGEGEVPLEHTNKDPIFFGESSYGKRMRGPGRE